MSKYLWKEISACKQQMNAASNYLDEPKKRRRWTPLITIGPKTIATKDLIIRVCGDKNYPMLPLLADNKDLREQTKTREKSPLFRVAASAISLKYNSLKTELKTAIAEEKSKDFPPQVLYRLEPFNGEIKEEKEILDGE